LAGVETEGGKAIGKRIVDHAGALRIQVHVHRGHRELPLVQDGKRREPLLEQLAARVLAAVPILRVSLRERAHAVGERAPIGRAQDQVNMVGHERCGVHPAADVAEPAFQVIKESLIVARIREQPSPVVSAQDHVVGQAGRDESKGSSHGELSTASARSCGAIAEKRQQAKIQS
jgi:hypothetical protein